MSLGHPGLAGAWMSGTETGGATGAAVVEGVDAVVEAVVTAVLVVAEAVFFGLELPEVKVLTRTTAMIMARAPPNPPTKNRCLRRFRSCCMRSSFMLRL